MRRRLHIIILIAFAALIAGCTGTSTDGRDTGNRRVSQPSDTLYTMRAAMSIFAYQPERALQIIDSAVIVGNISEVRADICRARVYSRSLMTDRIDSLLSGPKDVRLDSAQQMCERLLLHDSVKADLFMRQDVLETLAHTERMQNDTVGWLLRLRELTEVCRQQGAETDALRTDAEIGAALYYMGQQEQGMAKLDSAIQSLTPDPALLEEGSAVKGFRFNELDALIIALKRKIMILASHDKYAETLPLARRIIKQLDDYEAHPDAYHDGSLREPKNDQKRDDYIRFYRNQAQNFLTAAYSALGEHGSMIEAFKKIELSVRDATAREHIARYNALQQRMEVEHQRAITGRANIIATAAGIIALLLLAFAVYVIIKNKAINRKNRILARQIAEAVNYKELYWKEKRNQMPTAVSDISNTSESSDTHGDEQLFQQISDVIIREQLFLDPKFGRQTIMDRFQLSKERVGAIFSKGSEYHKLTNYILQLRLEYAARLLVEQPDKSIVQIAASSGFSSGSYFSDRFRQHFGMSPTDYRQEALE